MRVLPHFCQRSCILPLVLIITVSIAGTDAIVQPSTSRNSLLFMTGPLRGGGGGGVVSNDELDAYIENLISSTADDEVQDEDLLVDETENEDMGHLVENENSEEEVSTDEGEEEPNIGGDNEPLSKPASQTWHSGNGESTREDGKKRKKKVRSPDTEESNESPQPPTIDASTADTRISKEEKSLHTNDPAPTLRGNDNMRKPPNALYRFLLHQGIFGHTLVMFCILFTEWSAAYVPPLANFFAWLWIRIFGSSHRGRFDHDFSLPPRTQQTNVVALTSRRTGQTGKQRRALNKQADQAALAQLKRVGDVQQAKYKYLSLDFMQRHGLGSFAASEPINRMHDIAEEANTDNDVVKKSIKHKQKEKAGKTSISLKEDVDEEVDWVVKALTADLSHKSRDKSAVTAPAFSVGVSSGDGVTVGVEISIGRRQAVLEAITSERKAVQTKKAGPRLSDRDGGDGFFGKIRAAAGANSLMSRSLLGAYPGDAVAPDEAANAHGVTDLAQKYGWGDWSDDEDAENDGIDSSPLKRRRRKKHQSNTRKRSSSIGAVFGSPLRDATDPKSVTFSSRKRRRLSNEKLLDKLYSSTSHRKTPNDNDERVRSARQRRPPMMPATDRITTLQRQKSLTEEED